MSKNSTAKPPVTCLVITRNEEKYIERCLASLTWAKNIVVVDALSTDKTKSIVMDPHAAWAGQMNFFERQWDGFKNQRNFALSKASEPWILSIDADECCSQDLASKICSFFLSANGPPHPYFKIRRIEYFLGKPIQYGIWNPSYQDRFFLKNGVQYVNDIHEYPKFPLPPSELHEPIEHAPDFHIEKFLDKMNRYTTIEAQNRFDQGQRTTFFKMLFAFTAMFFKNYFYYSAYKDGAHGFAISLLEGISRTVRHAKMWQIQTRSDRPIPK